MKKYTNCPICNSSSFKKYLVCTDYTVSKESFNIVECQSCNFHFTDPIPDENELGKYYESEEYISHSNTSKGLVNFLYQQVRNHTLKQKVKLLKSISKQKDILDIGCGTGDFLNACRQMGYKITGIEPSETARKHASSNFNIEPKEEAYLDKIDGESVGIISMWHVLEHVYHLNERIRQIHRILINNGHLIVAVPNHTSYDAKKYGIHWAAYDVPRHLYHFSPNDIERLFEKHGFSLEKVLPMKFDSYYVSMLSEKYKKGSGNLVGAFISGIKSNLKANSSNNTYSSQIYILKKLPKEGI